MFKPILTNTAVPGLILGATYGTLRTKTPILFSLVSGAQWFVIGSTFWTIRSTILSRNQLENWWNQTRGAPLLPPPSQPTSQDRIRASAISGAFTGFTLGFLFRGPRNVIPGTIMFSLFGWAGQRAYNMLDERNTVAVRMEEERAAGTREQAPTLMQRMAKSKWSPLSVLTDEEYEKMMGERLLSVEADIALIDDKIEGLRKQQKEQDAQRESDPKAKVRSEQTK